MGREGRIGAVIRADPAGHHTRRPPSGVAVRRPRLATVTVAGYRSGFLTQDPGETHEYCPRNALRASRRNARVAEPVKHSETSGRSTWGYLSSDSILDGV